MLGRIVKGVGGFFFVRVEDGGEYGGTTIICNSKGIFRKEKIKPLVGDLTEIEINPDNRIDREIWGIITKICERKNSLARPALANLDKLFIVASVKSPSMDYYFVDKLTAIAVNNGIEPVITLNKTDLAEPFEIISAYQKTPFEVIATNITVKSDAGIRNAASGKVSAFCGMSGVGKSSVINSAFPDLKPGRETGVLSEKIGRGRHTTRAAELLSFEGGYIADTPGFSMLNFEDNIRLEKGERLNLIECFPDLSGYAEDCRFKKCSHTKESGCAVLRAAAEGRVSKSRHESYVLFYYEMKESQKW